MGMVIVNAVFTFQDETDPQRLNDTVTQWAAISFSIGVFIHVVETAYKIQFATAGEGLTRQLRKDTLQQLLRQEMGYFDQDENSVGELTEFLAQKVSLVQGMAQDGFQQLIFLLTLLTSALAISCTYGDWRQTVTYFLVIVVGLVVTVIGQVFTGSQPEEFKPKGAPSDEESEEAVVAGALVGEVVGAIKTVCSFSAEHKFLKEYSETVKRERERLDKKVGIGSVLMGMGMGIMMANFGCSLFYGMWLMEADMKSFVSNASGECPLPTVDSGRLMVPLMTFFSILMALGSNAAVVTDANAGKTAAEALFTRIDRPSQRDPFSPEGSELQVLRGDIELKDVVFAYPTSLDCLVCRSYSLVIPAGTTCALVGPSGAGKSTIVSLLLRFYDPQCGIITLDGHDITTLNLAWLRKQMGLVSQEPVLFQGTVADNIRYGKEGATQEEVEEAAKQANAHGFITNDLGNGYDTQVGLRGSQLSGGQKQRIAIARALVRKPTIMLLDEATSALDSESERIVQSALDEMMTKQKRTTIVIAHRLSTIRNANQIAVVSKGQIVECGMHDALLTKGGLYAELLGSQGYVSNA
jgi:ATP-binding cassette, subfamily B (MDR/TAP), member 1